jgi:two-component system sensor histidine kinase/response regulator
VTALLGQFAAVIAVCFLVFGASLYLFIIAPTMGELASNEVGQASRAVAVRLRRDIQQIEQLLLTVADWGRTGVLDTRDVPSFNRLMRPILDNDPRLSAALLAGDDGSELMLLEQPGEKWSNRITAPASQPGARHHWLLWHGDDPLPTEEDRPSSYDPRQRPWFTGAVEMPGDLQVNWTDAYQFFTTREPGITVSTRWHTPDGLVRVFGLDVLLADLSRITTSIPVGVRGGVIVITPDGELLGLPRYPRFADPNEIRRAVFGKAQSIGIEFVARGTEAWVAGGKQVGTVRFEAESITWRGNFQPIDLGGHALWIGAFAPDADFVPARARDLGIFAGLLAAVVALGVLMAVRFARRVRRPLRALVAQSERIGKLDLAPGPAIDAPWRELATLVDSQHHTRAQLADATARLEQAREALEDRVEERTAALAGKQAELANQLLFVQVLIDAVPNPIFYKGPDGRFLGCNQAYEITFGTTRAFLQGKTVLDLDYLPASDRVAYHDEDMRVIAEAAKVQKEVTMPFADGQTHDTLYWVSGFRLSDGQPGGLLGIIVDITETKDAERRARDAEAQLRSILESSPIAVVIADLDGMPVFANSRAAQMAGLEHEAFMRLPTARRYVDPAEREQALAVLAAGGQVRDREVALHHAGGEPRWALLTLERSRLGNAEVILSWTYDITPLKRVERELRKLSLAVEQSPVMIVITSPSGVVEYVNPHFTRVTGYTAEDELPEVFDAQGNSTDVFATLWQTLKAGRVWQQECQSRKKGGEHFWVSIAVSGLTDDRGNITHCIWVLEDVSTRKAADTALRRAKRLAEEAADTKARFLANMSHEIRTPMNAIIGLSHLCLETSLDAQQQDYLRKIQQSGTALLKVINDVLDVSRLEAGRVEIESVDFRLDEVLDHVITLVGQRAQEKGLELLLDVDTAIPHRLEGDPFRLGQVLTNLVGNAIKFTERGEVRLAVRPARRQSGRIELAFSVSDTGIGIEPAQQQHLFEAFAQADGSTTRKFGGSGLGLSISRHLVELMGGQMQLQSQPGVGSTFSFALGFGVHGEVAEAPLPGQLDGLRVLVVDDHPSAREVLCSLLSALPFRTESAPSALEAIAALKRADLTDPFGLVLMDWRMPGIDGLEATRRIKHDAGLVHPPVLILVTAFGSTDLSVDALEAGADAQVFKPLTASSLVDAIMHAYGLERAMAALPDAGLSAHVDLRGLSVLVVEDNEINQQIARALLESRGVVVHVAPDGQRAIDWLSAAGADAVDAVLMDLQMPGLDGYAATRQLRADPRFTRIPIIAMTAHALPDERERCLAAGMNDHVAKPIDPNRLFETLGRWTHPITPPEVPDAQGSMPPIDGLDTEAALRRMGGNTELYRRLLHQFGETQIRVPDTLRELIAQGQLAEAEQLAHTSCGLAANIGAGALASQASAIETALRTGQVDDAAIAAFTKTMSALVAAIRRQIPARTTVTPAAVSTTDVLPSEIVARLRQMILQADGDCGRYFSQIRDALVNLFGSEPVGSMAEAIQVYDFTRALQILDTLAGPSSHRETTP